MCAPNKVGSDESLTKVGFLVKIVLLSFNSAGPKDQAQLWRCFVAYSQANVHGHRVEVSTVYTLQLKPDSGPNKFREKPPRTINSPRVLWITCMQSQIGNMTKVAPLSGATMNGTMP